MSDDRNSGQKTGPEKLASTFVTVARFGGVIQIVVFVVLANVIARWVASPIAHAIAALVVFVPSYWIIPRRRIGLGTYILLCLILTTGLAFIEYLIIP